MIKAPKQLIESFVSEARSTIPHLRNIQSADICHELVLPTHKIGPLNGRFVVYAFTLNAICEAPLGRNRGLKVGRVSPGANQRFVYQHYLPKSAGSNLARSIQNFPIVWSLIGYTPSLGIADWIRTNTDRDHFFVPSCDIAEQLELFIRARIGSVFEGAANLKAPS
jgi:hypothetical protein